MKKLLLATMLLAMPAVAQDTPSAPDTRLYFVGLEDGAKVSAPLTVVFGLAGMGVAPAETERENTGHHHLLIDRAAFGMGEDGAAELTASIPADDNHKHFGGGQTQVTLDLPPGEHTLQLVLGDHGHVPHLPPVTSDRITVTVE